MNQSFTHEPLKPERIIIDRGQGPQEVETTHQLFVPNRDEVGNPVSRGPFIGLGVRDDRGFEFYCQPSQIVGTASA